MLSEPEVSYSFVIANLIANWVYASAFKYASVTLVIPNQPTYVLVWNTLCVLYYINVNAQYKYNIVSMATNFDLKFFCQLTTQIFYCELFHVKIFNNEFFSNYGNTIVELHEHELVELHEHCSTYMWLDQWKPSMLACKFWPIFKCLKFHNFLIVASNSTKFLQ